MMDGRCPRVLVVDDDRASRDLMAKILRQDGYEIEEAADGTEAIARARAAGQPPVDLVVSDIRMVEADGLEVLKVFRATHPDTPVILVTAFGNVNVDDAMDAIRQGAFDYLSKPYQVDAIKVVVGRALQQKRLAEENRTLRREVREKYKLENIVGRSEAMLQVYKTAARVAATAATVLIQGESGSGKELLARAIHQRSARAAGPFIAVDCGALAEGVLESELFGHAKGAFTGAQGVRRGLFEQAGGGTIFLDEIGNVTPKIQAQLLRVLQEGEVRPVGQNEPTRVDVRAVAATNLDLEQAVKEGRFREDLYYRLNVVTIRLPPLRERPEDLPLLAEHFVRKHAQNENARLSNEALALLTAYRWPGNVRELENVIARALALNASGAIVPDDLPDSIRQPGAAPASGAPAKLFEGRPQLSEIDRRYAELVLSETGGNKSKAAEVLGID
ncbi:MAG TPA: sigma-54 dependent transcriptional regulator, partial [Myxococcales bacterium]|nr:sigma-54 dependent transcriptional regulator [Myxococcales bacterium]